MIILEKYAGKNIGVLGLARSGSAIIKAMQYGGAVVQAWDDSETARNNIAHNNINEDNGNIAPQIINYENWDWAKLDLLVVSPAIQLNPHNLGNLKTHPAVELARKNNVRITCDISLLMEQCPDAIFVGITGTNGKSTTTALIAHSLAQIGARVECGGNIGVAALELAPLGLGEYYVLELSSYQLEAMDTGTLNIACLLNITPDHLERHGRMEHYVTAKERIFQGQGANDRAIIALDDEYLREIHTRHPHAITVSAKSQQNNPNYYVKSNKLIDGDVELDLSMMKSLQGAHNHQNALIAYATLRALGFDATLIAQAMQSFQGLPHRMERIAEWDGMLWVNDSKATNADAAQQSLATYRNIHWIVGGALKQGGIDSLAYLQSHVTHAYVIGAQTEAIATSLEQMNISYDICGTMNQAVMAAFESARGQNNAVILLAPAAASFDQYSNFEERGEHFRDLVLGLKS